MREPDAQVTVDVDVHSIRARENWQLVKTAAAGARALTAFKTLRDMHSDVVMDFSQLEVVSRLGGAIPLPSAYHEFTAGLPMCTGLTLELHCDARTAAASNSTCHQVRRCAL